MRFAISLPQLDTNGFDGASVKAYLTRAEELGFESGWTLEQSIGGTPLIAPLPMLAYAAACTERLRLGVAVLVTTLHDPLQLAHELAGIDRLSNGRLEIGVSAGGGFRNFAAFGVDRATFVTYFTEGLELMKATWSDSATVTFDGRFRKVEDQAFAPKPVQRPHPPIWFGAGAPRSIARAVRLGDAFMGAGSSSTEAFSGHVVMVREQLDAQGRDPDSFPIAKRVYVAVDDDPRRAREQVETGLRRVYGQLPGILDVPVSGTPDQVIEGLHDVAQAGAGMILLNPLGSHVAADREQMERLAAEVCPALG